VSIFSTQVDVTGGFDLPARPLTSTGKPFERARILVRVAGEPVGFATLALGEQALDRSAVFQRIQHDLGPAVNAELEQQGLPKLQALADRGSRIPAPRPSFEDARNTTMTVVVCTRDRAAMLRPCLESLARLKYGNLDFLIVDNAPSDDATRNLIAEIADRDSRFRYAKEPQPGLSRARNCGLVNATGEVVAYTDDDVRVDPLWICGLLRGFHRRPDIACVTGLVASASLELPAERFFDARVWWSSSCEHCLYDACHGTASSALYPYAAGIFGTGANFAFRSTVLRALGGFDERLGAGSPCGGGEDLDIFVRVIHAGHSISYEPAALVWHEHRVDRDDLQRQMYFYGKGLSAYLYKYASSRDSALDILRRLPRGVRHLIQLTRRATKAEGQTDPSRNLLLAEIRGWIAGPVAYQLARRHQELPSPSALARRS
jgi:glycosyltransferase involved in cell wall biosynthesis